MPQGFNIKHTNVIKIKGTRRHFNQRECIKKDQTTPTLSQVHREQETFIGQTHEVGIKNAAGGIL